MKPVGKISALCAAVAVAALLGGTPAHAQGDGGLLGLGLLNTPSITLACFPSGQVGQGNSFTGTQNVGCSQSASATSTTPSGNGGLTGRQTVSSSATGGPGELVIAGVSCPAGTVVTGGGYATDLNSSWDVKSSSVVEVPVTPANGDGGWSAVARNTGTGSQTLYVYAVCFPES
ncbi:hypothetical protein ACIRD3_36960 [Kitasatospora sp. NPDC093550]|uniref:hypothetical protein n=1 Tax=Kitasatospora sp. NPDC093550 TaxID=3364089 RepID=UPI0037FC0BD3